MRSPGHRPLSNWLAVGALSAAGCTYDFDEPFSRASGSGGSPATTSSAGGADPGAGGGATGGGATGGSATGGSATGGGATGGGATGGSTGMEDCTNSGDDDGDGQVDCADTDCAGFGCVPAAPIGWTGPALVLVAASPGACPATWPTQTDLGAGSLSAPPAQCNACMCSAGSITCSLAQTIVYDGTNCSGVPDFTITPVAEGVCGAFSGTDVDTFEGGASVAGAGSCPPTGGGVASLPAATWSSAARICLGGTPGGGCNGGGACMPPPAAGFAVCVTSQGDVPCPVGYPSKTVAYGDFNDGRTCSACACGASGGNCTAQTEIWTSPGCVGVPDAVIANDGSSCQHEHLLSVPAGSFKFTASGGGACQSSGGQPSGSVSPSQPTTICCTP